AIGGVRCYPIGSVTIARAGDSMAALRGMAKAGAVAFSDDGATTASLKALYHAARLIADLPQPFLSHCDDPAFEGALMNEGAISDLLGVAGAPNLAEAAIAARDLLVARVTGKRWHLCLVRARVTIDVVRWARSTGVDASGEATPHHDRCTDDQLLGFDASMRVNPPLRSATDVRALKAAVVDGTIDIFASDHAPHAPDDKEPPLSHACVGFSGLETAVAAMFDTFRDLPIATLVANFSTNVARLLGVEGGTLAPGSPADITGLHLERQWTVDPAAFLSKGRATAFSGQAFDVKPAMSVVGGAIVYAVDRSGRPLQGPNAARRAVKA
ncbi:MAG: amidohydrolase family protein, partial [Candidatus Eremiobacterales bacterium]